MTLSRIAQLLNAFDPFPTSPEPALPFLEKFGGPIRSSGEEEFRGKPVDPKAVLRAFEEIYYRHNSLPHDTDSTRRWRIMGEIQVGYEGLKDSPNQSHHNYVSLFSHDDRQVLLSTPSRYLPRGYVVQLGTSGSFAEGGGNGMGEVIRTIEVNNERILTTGFSLKLESWIMKWGLAHFVGMVKLPNPLDEGIESLAALADTIKASGINSRLQFTPPSSEGEPDTIELTINQPALPEAFVHNIWDPLSNHISNWHRLNRHLLSLSDREKIENPQAAYGKVDLRVVTPRPIAAHELERDALTGRQRVVRSRVTMGWNNMPARMGARAGLR